MRGLIVRRSTSVIQGLAEPAGQASTFWPCLWLAVALVLTKAVLLGLPWDWSWRGMIDYVSDLAIIAHADILFALGIGLVSHVAIYLCARRPSLERAVWAVLVLVCVVSVIYGIMSVQVFSYLRTPLTYPLLYLAGDMKNMRSSVGAFVTPPLVTALVAGPLVYLLCAWSTHRLIQPKRTLWFRVGQVIALGTTLVYCLLARQAAAGPWSDRPDRRMAENPHWVLMSSLLTELAGERTVQLAEEFPQESWHDFEIVAERTEATLPIPSQTHRPTNVILYVLESVGTQQLGLYGSRYETTPKLTAEAAHSLVFDQFYAHVGVTANSLVAITLSIYPGMSWREYTVEQPDLPGTALAQVLRARGYRTAYMTSGDIEYVHMDRFLAHRGFDTIWGYEQLGCGPLLVSWGVEDRCLVDSMVRWIDQDRDRPFFLMAWTQQTHHPYEPSPNQTKIDFFQGRDLPPDDYDLGRYLNVLREADSQLGRLFDALRERDLADDTLVVITGDHGEGFGAPHPTFGHGGKVYEEIVKVPLVLWNPRLYDPGRRAATIGSHIDVNPTVLDLLGMTPPDSWQGRSLFDQSRPPRAYFYAASDDYLLGVREHNWKYIYNATVGRDELFDLSQDPEEQTNRAREQTEKCRDLRQRLAAWMKYEERHVALLRELSRRRKDDLAGAVH